MGTTSIPRELFIEMLADLRPRYNMTSYDLIKNNCNNFTNDVVTFLTGRPIPPCAFLFCLSRVGLCHPLLTTPLPPLPPLPQNHSHYRAAGGGTQLLELSLTAKNYVLQFVNWLGYRCSTRQWGRCSGRWSSKCKTECAM